MPLDSGNVTIAPDGTATGDGLAKLIYDALADEHDAFPGQVPAPNTPGAQESLARLARGIAEPIAIAVNEGVEVTADPGEVLGNPIDSGSPLVAHPITPAQLNAIVGSVTLRILQSLIMAERSAGAALTAGYGQFYPKDDAPSAPYFRDDTNVDRRLLTAPAALSDLASQAEATVLLRARGAGPGVPIAGSGAQLGSIFRMNGAIADSTSSGTIASYTGNGTTAFDQSINVLNFNGVTCTIHGFPAPAEPGQVLYIRHIGAGAVTLPHNSASALLTAERIVLNDGYPAGGSLVLGTGSPHGRNAAFIYQGSRWQMLNNAMLPLLEQAAGPTLVAGQGVYWVKNDAPNNPYFRDDTNVDRKLLTAPAALSDLATVAIARVLGNPATAVGAAAPQALTGAQIAEIIRWPNRVIETIGGALDNYPLSATADYLSITANAVLSGIVENTGSSGRRVIVANGAAAGSGVVVDIVNFSISTGGYRIVTPKAATLRLYPGDAVALQHGITGNFWFCTSGGTKAYYRTNSVGLGASRSRVNFVNGPRIGWSNADVPANDEVTITPVLLALTEIEETGAGPFNDYNPGAARHIMASNAAGVFTGVAAAGFVVGDELIFSHQGTGYTELQHNTTSATANRFFNGRQGLNLRIFDNEIAVYRLVDTAAGAGTTLLWELMTPQFPFAHSSVNANGDTLVHNGTNWVSVAGYQTTSNINLSAVSGSLGVVDITALASGGSVTLQPSNPLNIDGFTAKTEGFTFLLLYRDTSAHLCTLNENAGNTTTSIRCPFLRALNFTQLGGVMMRYSFSRWRATPMQLGSDLILRERNVGETLAAAYGQFWVKDDAPNNPYFRDDTNVDRKLLTAPAALSDLATITQGTQLGRTILGGTGVPVALTGLQQGENIRRATAITDTLSTGTVASYAILEDTCQVIFSGAGVRAIDIHGAAFIIGKEIEWCVDQGSGAVVRFFNDSVTAPTNGERLRTPSGQTITLRAGEQVTTVHQSNRHRMSAPAKRIDPELIAPTRANIGVIFNLGPFTLTASGAGASDFIAYNADAPFAFRILAMVPRITGAAAGTVQARTGAGGGGVALSSTFDGSVVSDAPAITAALGATATVALGGTVIIRSTNGNIAGEVNFTCVRV